MNSLVCIALGLCICSCSLDSSRNYRSDMGLPFRTGMKLNGALANIPPDELAKNLRPILATAGAGYRHTYRGRAVGLWEYYSKDSNQVYRLSIQPFMYPFAEDFAKIACGEVLTTTQYYVVRIE